MLAHIAVAVEDVHQATGIYSALGFVAGEPEIIERENIRLVKVVRDGLCIELIESYPAGAGSVARFIAKRGAGLHHIALSSTDLMNDLNRLGQSSIKVLPGYPAKGAAGSNVAFLDPRTTGGVLIELVEK